MGKITRRLAKGMRAGGRGFTLIELLIVVAILGILAAVIIPNVATFMNTGKLNAARTEAENMKTAAMAYYADNGVWPPNVTAITTGNYTSAAPKCTTYVWTAAGVMSATNNTYDGLFTWDPALVTWKK
jgi:type IV pilus assembly protein PilA